MVVYDQEFYLNSQPNMEPPIWAAGALYSIAAFWRLGDDEDVRKAIHKLTISIVSKLFKYGADNYIENLDGIELTTLAIRDDRFAAQVGDTFRLQNGEPVEVDNEWTIFQI